VAVLLSGGVDSSLALALLKAAGHEVHAFYLQIWFQEDFRNFWDSCPWEEDLDYAEKVLSCMHCKTAHPNSFSWQRSTSILPPDVYS
jgi:tRNA-5-taurinomethyluridine 2-sulfurtransferase